MKQLITALLVLFGVNGFLFAQFSRISNQNETWINNLVQDAINNDQIVGASVGIVKNGQIVFMKGYGKADVGNNIDATECTVYRLGSVSKVFTAVAALQLIDEGKLNLSDKISQYLPGWPTSGDKGNITVRDLLCHQSGIYDESNTHVNYMNNNLTFNANTVAGEFSAPNLLYTPGSISGSTTGTYSNPGYSLLAGVVENAGGETFTEHVRNNVTKPFNMPYLQPEYEWRGPYPNETKGYSINNGNASLLGNSRGFYKAHLGAGAFIGSVVDLSIFIQKFGANEVFNDQNMRDDQMLQVHSFLSNKGWIRYGYGMIRETRNGDNFWYHGGGIPGGGCNIYFSEDKQSGVVVLTNSINSYGPALDISRDIIDGMNSISVSLASLPFTNTYPLTPAVSITGSESGTEVHNSRGTINMQNYTINASADVRVDADRIVLKPGVTVKSGSLFLAHPGNGNENCPQHITIGSLTKNSEEVVEVKDQMKLYPNPSSGVVNAEYSDQVTELAVFNAVGQQVLYEEANQNGRTQLNMSEFPKGIYLVKFIGTDGIIENQKLIIR